MRKPLATGHVSRTSLTAYNWTDARLDAESTGLINKFQPKAVQWKIIEAVKHDRIPSAKAQLPPIIQPPLRHFIARGGAVG